MKSSAVILALAAVLLLSAGCERDKQAIEPAAYDARIDGAYPCLPPLNVDPEFTAIRAFVTGQAAPVSAEAPTSAAPEPTEQVKRVMIDLLAAARADERQRVLSFFVESDAALLRPLGERTDVLKQKLQQAKELVKTRLDTELPEEESPLEMVAPKKVLVGDPEKVAIEDFQFQAQDANVVVSGKTGSKLTFVSTPGGWKAQLDEAQKQSLQIIEEVLAAMENCLDALVAGVNDGSINKDNLKAKSDEIAEKFFTPLLPKLSQLMAAAIPSAGKETGKAPQEAVKKPEGDAAQAPPGTEPEKPTGDFEMGKTYRLKDVITLYQGDSAFQTTTSRFLEAGSTLKFVEIMSSEEGMMRYKVEAATADGEQIGTGYVSPVEAIPDRMELVTE